MRSLVWGGLFLLAGSIFVSKVSALNNSSSTYGHSITQEEYRSFLRVFSISPIKLGQKILAEECNPYSSVIYGGGVDVTGYSSVTNTETNLNINLTSSVGAGWFIKNIQLYAGSEAVPVTETGAANLAQFPIQDTFAEPQAAYAYSIPLPSTTCGAAINIAIHLTMVQLDQNNVEIAQENSWVIGPVPFADGNGSYFNYTVCCQAPVEYGCTEGAGYWKTHNRYALKAKKRIPWPISEDTILCGKTWYTYMQIEEAEDGNLWQNLAKHWISAKLNVAAGASSTEGVDAAIAESEALLAANCRTFPKALRPTASEKKMVLKSYNNGEIGPGLCVDSN